MKQSDGYVGIGIASPTTKFHIDDNATSGTGLLVTGGGAGQPLATFTRDVGGGGSVEINSSDSRPQIKLAASSNTFALGVNGSTFEIADNFKLGTNARLSITDTGNVGIGTTSPSYLLDLESTATGLTHNLKLNKSSTTGDYAEIAFQLWSGAGTGLNTFGGSGTSRPSVVLRAINENGSQAAGAFAIATFTGGATNSTLTEKFRLTSAGNVGIGTTSPFKKLDLGATTSDTDIALNYSDSGTNLGQIGFALGSNKLISGDSDGDLVLRNSVSGKSIIFGTQSTERVRIDSAGTVIVGAIAPRSSSVPTRFSVQAGMSEFETTLTNNNDWENSAISILERDNVGSTQSADKYSPNLNFHWSARVSNSLWMNSSGHLNWGSFGSNGIPNADGVFQTNTINLIGTGRITGVDTVTDGTDAANKDYVDAQVGNADTLQEVTDNGNTTTNSVGIGTTSANGLLQVGKYTVASQGNQGTYGNLSSFANSDTDNIFLGLKNGSYPNRGFAFRTVAVGVNSDFTIYEHGQGSAEVFRITAGGNVGIGTTSPDSKLSVTSSTINSEDILYLKSGADNVNDYLGIAWEIGAGGNGPHSAIRSFAGPSGSDARLGFLTTSNGGTTLTEGLSVAHNGNVGIGTTNPAAKLELLGKQMITAGANAQPQTEDYLYIGGDGLAGANAAIYIGNRGNGSGYGWRMFYEGTGDGINNKLKFKSENLGSPVDVITMLQDGKVGIGATEPSVGLQLGNSTSGETKTAIFNSEGGAEIGLKIKSRTNRAKLAVSDNDTTAYVVAEGTIASFGRADTAATTNISVLADGDVGIGTTNPAKKLHVLNSTNEAQIRLGQSGSGSYDLGVYANDTFSIGRDADTQEFNIKSGNVGIGITSPSYKLEVNGGILAGGKVTYHKSAGSLTTTGYAVAGLVAGSNGMSAGFTFTCFGHTGDYQKIVYGCYNSSGTWNTQKVIDEGTNDFDVTASANGSTITFTFKSRSGTKSYTPRVSVEAFGSSINNTYA